MTESNIDQIGNTAGGDVIGRDKIDNSTTIFNAGRPALMPALSTLYKKYSEEVKGSPTLKENIDKFDYFTTPFRGDVIGLEAKLANGKLTNIDYAREAKETFHKQLYKNQFFESAQKINCFFLSLVQSYFNSHVYPVLNTGLDEAAILALVQEKVVDRLLYEVGENVLDLMAIDIQGMLYFLTGNCHINWSK